MGIAELLKRLAGFAAPEDPVKLEIEEMRKIARKAVKRSEEVVKESRKAREGEAGGLLRAAEELGLEYGSAVGEHESS